MNTVLAGTGESPFLTANPETRPFWDAAAGGRFVLPRCTACGRRHWYPRPLCPFCLAGEIVFEPASGLGRIHAFSIMRRAREPYAIAYVKLDEGPTMMTNIVDCALADIHIDQRVALVFKPAGDGRNLPMFTPVDDAGG